MNASSASGRITLTVGLPMYRSVSIGWLALEGLCRQADIGFRWELIVAEEPEEAFTEERLRAYAPRLKAVGCGRIAYLPCAEWVPLSVKWRRIAEAASTGSEMFLLQAADCYSQPHRLASTAKLFEDPAVDWVQAPVGPFFDLITESVTLYDHALVQERSRPDTGRPASPCALNMATRTRYMRQLADERVAKSVDRWLFSSIKDIKQAPLVVACDESDGWRHGLDTHGLNQISHKRGFSMQGIEPPFRASDLSIDEIVPPDIVRMLKEARLDAAARLFRQENENNRKLRHRLSKYKAAAAKRDATIATLRQENEELRRSLTWHTRLANAILTRLRRFAVSRRKDSGAH